MNDLSETLQFIDESGEVLGLFMPRVDYSRLKPQISEEEIRRRIQDGGGRTLAEIKRDFESRK